MTATDCLVFLAFACVPVVGLIGFLLGYMWQRSRLSKICLGARFKSWSLANLVGVVLTLVILLLIAFYPTEDYVNSTGYATAIPTFLTVLFAFNKLGFHDVVQMSREAAWRIHYAFGLLTLFFGCIHTVIAVRKLGVDGLLGDVTAATGSISLLLMFMGIIPAKFFIYDHFKLLHFQSFLGFLFVVFNTVAAAFAKRSFLTIFTAVMFCLLVLVYLGQKILVRASSWKATVQNFEVVWENPSTRHIFLYLSAPGFSSEAGQWARLSIPSISPVAHPFTVIPVDGEKLDANVAIFIKVAGTFTQKLADRLNGEDLQDLQMSLRGPWGSRPRFVSPMAFVAGGVGVTPALSLLKSHTGSALFWASRSEALVQNAYPLLPNLHSLSCVKVNGNLVHGQDVASISEWLEKVTEHHAAEGRHTGTIFVCGPARMSEEVRRAVKARGVQWQVHTEEFRFLPEMFQPRRSERPRANITKRKEELSMIPEGVPTYV